MCKDIHKFVVLSMMLPLYTAHKSKRHARASAVAMVRYWALQAAVMGAIMVVGSGMGVMLLRGASIQSEWCHCIRAIMAGVAIARLFLYRCYMNKKSFLPEDALLPTAQFHLRSCLKAWDAFMFTRIQGKFPLNIINPFCDFERLTNVFIFPTLDDKLCSAYYWKALLIKQRSVGGFVRDFTRYHLTKPPAPKCDFIPLCHQWQMH